MRGLGLPANRQRNQSSGACSRIGHLVVDCPRKKAADARKKQLRQERQERARTTSEQAEEPKKAESVPESRTRTKSEVPGGNDSLREKEKQTESTGFDSVIEEASIIQLKKSLENEIDEATRERELNNNEIENQLTRLLQNGSSQTSAKDEASEVQSLGPVLVPGAFNAEDLEASFREDSEKVEKPKSSFGPPPGFGGLPLLQNILGSLGPGPSPLPPPHIIHRQQQLHQFQQQQQLAEHFRRQMC